MRNNAKKIRLRYANKKKKNKKKKKRMILKKRVINQI